MSIQRERLIRDGELDLLELSKLAWEKRKFILVWAQLGILLGLSWLWISAPVYQVRAILGPPSASDLVVANIGRGGAEGLELIVASMVFDRYVHALGSEVLRRHFFDSVHVSGVRSTDTSHYLADEYVKFSKSLSVGSLSGGQGDRVVVMIKDSDPQRAANWVERYIDMAATRARDGLVDDLEREAALKVGSIERNISNARINAKQQREDEIARLDDALGVAQALGLEGVHEVYGRGLWLAEALPYLRGIRALEAEINELHGRISDDPYINGLRQQQAKVEFYRRLRIELATSAIYQQDGAVHVVDGPSKFRNNLAVTLVLMVMAINIILFSRLFSKH